MSSDEIERKYQILDALRRRRDQRELQRAQYGSSADPIIITEIDDLTKAIAKVEEQIEAVSSQINTSEYISKEQLAFRSGAQRSEVLLDKTTLKRELFREILRLLNENRIIHDQFGPRSKAGRNIISADGVELWKDRKREKIIPNNRKIIDLFEKHIYLLEPKEVLVFAKFREHASAFERNAERRIDPEFQPLFPQEFQSAIEKGASE